MNFEQTEQFNKIQQDEIERGFDFLESIGIKSRNVNRKYSTLRYFFHYLKPLPLFLFLALFFVINVDSSGGKTIISEMQGIDKYLFAAVTVLILFAVFAFLAAMLFPTIVQCEFKDRSYKTRLEINLPDAANLLKTVKTTENLKIMAAMIKNGVDNANDLSGVLLTLIASIGVFVGSFPILIGLKLLDGGVLTPIIGLTGIYLLNLLRLELAPQNLQRRIWLIVIETAQNLKSEERRIITPDKKIIVSPSNGAIQPAQFHYYNFDKRLNASNNLKD